MQDNITVLTFKKLICIRVNGNFFSPLSCIRILISDDTMFQKLSISKMITKISHQNPGHRRTNSPYNNKSNELFQYVPKKVSKLLAGYVCSFEVSNATLGKL